MVLRPPSASTHSRCSEKTRSRRRCTRSWTRCASAGRVKTSPVSGTRTTCSLNHRRRRLSSCESASRPKRSPCRRAPSLLSASGIMDVDVEIRVSVVSRFANEPPSQQPPSPLPVLTPITTWSVGMETLDEWRERLATTVGLPISARATRRRVGFSSRMASGSSSSPPASQPRYKHAFSCRRAAIADRPAQIRRRALRRHGIRRVPRGNQGENWHHREEGVDDGERRLETEGTGGHGLFDGRVTRVLRRRLHTLGGVLWAKLSLPRP